MIDITCVAQVDKKKKLDYDELSDRVGIIKISIGLLRLCDLSLILKMFYELQCMVIGAKEFPYDGYIEYTCLSPLFEKVEDGEVINEYRVIVNESDGDVSFTLSPWGTPLPGSYSHKGLITIPSCVFESIKEDIYQLGFTPIEILKPSNGGPVFYVGLFSLFGGIKDDSSVLPHYIVLNHEDGLIKCERLYDCQCFYCQQTKQATQE